MHRRLGQGVGQGHGGGDEHRPPGRGRGQAHGGRRREEASKVLLQIGMYSQAFQSNNKGNSGTARSKTTALDLSKSVPKNK